MKLKTYLRNNVLRIAFLSLLTVASIGYTHLYVPETFSYLEGGIGVLLGFALAYTWPTLYRIVRSWIGLWGFEETSYQKLVRALNSASQDIVIKGTPLDGFRDALMNQKAKGVRVVEYSVPSKYWDNTMIIIDGREAFRCATFRDEQYVFAKAARAVAVESHG